MEGVNLLLLVLVVVGSSTILDGLLLSSAMNSDIVCKENEKNSLIKFRQGFRNPSQSKMMSSWMLEENCCNWKGVECDNITGHVITLDLHQQFLQGEFGTSLLGLPYLRHLDLSQNDFLEDLFPEFIICKFKYLEYLNLHKTNFRGSIPEHLGNLSRLQFLDLGDGFSLRVDSLQWLQHLSNMRILDLSGVDLSNAKNWLHDISFLRSLMELRLSACHLPKLLPVSVNFTSLQVLDLSLNYLDAPFPSWLVNTSSQSLVHLNLKRSQLRGLLPNTAFGNMYSLRVLDLSENFILGKLPSFEGMTSVTFLDISRNFLEGNLPLTLPSKLKHLDLSSNNLEGPLAKSIVQLRQLVVLNVARNSFNDSITEHFLNFSDLRVLDLSSNSIILNITATWMPPFQLDIIGLMSCQHGTQFPLWLHTQKDFSFIDISHSNISDEVPDWFWNLSPKVQHMNLSLNYFRGEVPQVTSRLTSLEELDLSKNNFHGPLPHFSPKMKVLILSRNSFNGTISPVCESLVVNNSLMFLDLSRNFLSGTLSDCWRYGKNLAILNLGNNHLFGEIPHSFGYLATLIHLILRNNRLSNNLPLSLKNLQGLKILDLAGNCLSGNIPSFLGETSQNLMFLSLRKNKFNGNIPLQLCQLKNLIILDLSTNALSGTIPKCVKNFLTMAGVEEIPSLVYGPYEEYRKYVIVMLNERGYDHSFISSLSLFPFVILDLSDNHLSGEIPEEITTLGQLRLLNLSRNNLTGAIPCDISKMQFLEALDVSRNDLSSFLPSSMAELLFLELFNVSFNSLTGKIPIGRQFDTFENSSYIGNPELCGTPLFRSCSGHFREDITHCNTLKEQDVTSIHQHEEDNWLDESSFYISMGIGVITGFWAFWATLSLKTSWRHAYMRYLNTMGNKIYVFVAIRLPNRHKSG
ncbi:receptor-like protein EIX2 [Solanum dulcamara]|uniref:receptor-like protein EIX2 n=1 Tax=Solanum dulcamara TaxID=45834 RepID=UPI002484DED1|nr:receptor-like protein EIX2 [Solanum dulcamara]